MVNGDDSGQAMLLMVVGHLILVDKGIGRGEREIA